MIALKSIRADGTTRNGFQWPDSGEVVCDSHIDPLNRTGCPSHVGDGVCLGKTFYGMSLGGISAKHLLLVEYDEKDVRGEDRDKLRVCRCVLVQRLTIKAWLAGSPEAGSPEANLRHANLRHANLFAADLTGANLTGADLTGADLYGANMNYANLAGANLNYADLADADLTCTNLTGARGIR